MAVACGRGGKKVTSISSFKCGLFFWRWCPWRKMYLESVRLRLPGRYVAWRWQKDGSYQQGEAPFCSVPDSQVNNCRTSWQTKELAQLMTQGRWESCQHKTTREWSCLSGSCSPERRAGGGGALSSLAPRTCSNPLQIHHGSDSCRLPQPPSKRALWAACLWRKMRF